MSMLETITLALAGVATVTSIATGAYVIKLKGKAVKSGDALRR